VKRETKVQVVKNWEEDFNLYKTIFLLDYTGMNVSQAVALRKLLKKNSYKFKVLKNRLALRAVKEGFPPEFQSYFQKPTAAALAAEEPVKLARLLKEFSGQNKVMTFKGGMIEGHHFPPERFEEVCRLGSREELLGKIGYLMSFPLMQILRTWQAPLSQMGQLFSQYKEKK
jgi:large subunit ribosomal protein L10